ncbi:probable 28S ribosomal protein S10, mitochondrial [Exaiptasia diaphana]|uniref:Small ribosomal subunit protein uS10m n=1 Tax=Exaiptasia diaphana TaxID=2652724 RepID=A0A913WQL9_EXADI|nr:probable 28S ribosomal protein S10, mitochondrial [Exaiptasia diaphana]
MSSNKKLRTIFIVFVGFSQANVLLRCVISSHVYPTTEHRQKRIWKPLINRNTYSTLLVNTEKRLMKRDLIYPNILVTVKGYDAAVLDHFCQFIKGASHIFDLDVTKKFNLPTEKISQTIANPPDSYKKHKTTYEFKKHGRMMQIKEIPVEKADIWLQFVQSNLPEGVNLHIELKTWQDFVSPPDPRIEEQRKLAILRKKGLFNPTSDKTK